MEACFFGAGCTRSDCIYRHDRAALAAIPQSPEPCLAYLAGTCSFNARSCRKRHPPPAEAERLLTKYQTIRCRYGSECQTDSCLYRHPAEDDPSADPVAFLPPASLVPVVPPGRSSTAVPGTLWRSTLPPATAVGHSFAPPQQSRPVPSAYAAAPSFTPNRQTVPPLRTPPPTATTSAAAASFNIHAKEFVPGGGFG
jgi:hypothetical protein